MNRYYYLKMDGKRKGPPQPSIKKPKLKDRSQPESVPLD